MAGEFSIYFRAFLSETLFNKRFGLRVRATDTIHDVMEQLEEKSGVPPMMQRLTFQCQPRPMLLYHDTPGTLADLGIDEDAASFTAHFILSGYYALCRKTAIAMGLSAVDSGDDEEDTAEEGAAGGGEEKKMRIYVEDRVQTWPRVRKLALEVEAGDTVATVRARVHRRWGYPPEMQELWPDRGVMGPRSGGTLAGYHVTNGSTLKLFMCSRFAAAADRAERKLKKARMTSPPRLSPPTKSVEETEAVPPVPQQQQLADDKTAAA